MNLYDLNNLEFVDRVEVHAKVYMKDGTMFETDVPINAMMESSSFDRSSKFYQDVTQYERFHIHKLLMDFYHDENVLVLDNITTNVVTLPDVPLDHENYQSKILDFILANTFRIDSAESLVKFEALITTLTSDSNDFDRDTIAIDIETIRRNFTANGICLIAAEWNGIKYKYDIVDRYESYRKIKERYDKMLQESEKLKEKCDKMLQESGKK